MKKFRTGAQLRRSLHLGIWRCCSRWCSGVESSLRDFVICELGCGDGGNLNPIAFYNPESIALGIDNSRCATESAAFAAALLGLTNLGLRRCDVRCLEPLHFRPFDYIIAHGLYSWVPEDARDAILEFCARTLAPSGLAYISFNAQPGWATRRVVREMLLRSRSVREAPIEQKAERAIEVAGRLLEDFPSRDYASAVLLAEELERVRYGKPFYVFHEYLADVNDGFWLGEFVERARQHGLEYVTDAQFCRWEGHVPETLKATLVNRGLDPIEQEEVADLLCHRYFRASILCRADAPRTTTSHREILDQVHIATALAAHSETFELTDGVIERFLGAGEVEITLRASITKAAAVLLARQWPRGTPLGLLFRNASEFLVSHGFPVMPSAREQLVEDGLNRAADSNEYSARKYAPISSFRSRESPASGNKMPCT